MSLPICVAQHYSAKVIFHREAVFKADPTTSINAKVLYINSETFSLNRPSFSSAALSNSREPKMPVKGNVKIEGALDLELSPQMTELLYYVFGSCSSTAGPQYTHTIKIGALPSFLLEKGFTDIAASGDAGYFKYNGVKVNTFSLTIGSEGIVKCSIGCMGGSLTNSATTFDASATDNSHTPFDNASISLEEGGAPIAYVESVKLDVNNGLVVKYGMDGSGEPTCITAGITKITGTLTALFRNMTLYNKAINDAETSLKIAFTRGTGAGTSGNEALEFLINELKYAPKDPNIKGPGPISIELNFEGYYDDNSDLTAFKITAKNEIAVDYA